MKNITAYFFTFFSGGNERMRLVKKNISASLLIKGFSILIGLVLIPMTINFVNPTQYGIWLTMNSIISWFSFFDIGLGNGLKNKLAEANALKQYDKAATYISTTYAALAIISAIVFIAFLIGNKFIDWSRILNSPGGNLGQLTLILVGFFCIQFVAQLINTVLTASHKPAKVSLINLIGQIISLVAIYELKIHTQGSLLSLVLALAGIPILILVIANIWFYNTGYKKIAPKFSAIKLKYAKELLNTGGVFFIIQIGALILYQTDNIVITQLFGPQKVTVFNVAYKLFAVLIMSFNIILTPFWSAYTDAYVKKDFNWITETFNKTKKIWLAFSIAGAMILICSPIIYAVWLHGSVTVPVFVSFAMFLYTIGYNWMSVSCYLLNGLGKVRLQLYLYIFSIFFNIPLAIFFGKVIGIAGVSLSNVVIFIIMGTVLWIQCEKISKGTAVGIWNK